MALAVGGTIFDQTISGVWIALDEPFASGDLFSLRVACLSHTVFIPSIVGVELGWDQASPPAQFWSVAALAGAAISSDSPKIVGGAVRECVKRALESKYGGADLTEGRTSVDCMAFIDEGGGTSVRIGAADFEEPRGRRSRE